MTETAQSKQNRKPLCLSLLPPIDRGRWARQVLASLATMCVQRGNDLLDYLTNHIPLEAKKQAKQVRGRNDRLETGSKLPFYPVAKFCILRRIFLPQSPSNWVSKNWVSKLGSFKQHITCSTVTGIAVGGIAYHFGLPPSACLVSAGLCSFAGMLPDIDSDTSRSFQECIYLTAGIGCILTAARLRYYVDPDLAMLGGAFMFLLIRFGLAPLIKKITVHRGMIHSIPMAILCGELVFFVVTGSVIVRLVKAAALSIGFLSHLILDEVYSIDSTGATLRLKKSFGTALKWTNPKRQGSVTVLYSLIFIFGFAACTNPDVIEHLNGGVQIAEQTVPADKPFSLWGLVTSSSIKNDSQSLHDEIQREAAEFLAQQKAATPITLPSASELPAAMQIGTDWNRNLPIQPAKIVLQ